MICSLANVDPERRSQIMQILDIDPEWRMHRVSDGQRRRVQICMGLLRPPEVPSCWTMSRAFYRLSLPLIASYISSVLIPITGAVAGRNHCGFGCFGEG
jgi:hypothetical protein